MSPSRAGLLRGAAPFLGAIAVLAPDAPARAQGCVVARQGAPLSGLEVQPYAESGHWQLSTSYRGFRSDRHFRGDVEETERAREGSEVINDDHTLDTELAYALDTRFSLTVGVPWSFKERSEPIRNVHGEVVARSRTSANGVGDVVLGARGWLLDPAGLPPGNLALGLGLKLPTGDYNAVDAFRTQGGGTEVRVVDDSIQPGDGGLGVVASLSGFASVGRVMPYASASYLLSPREQVTNSGHNGAGDVQYSVRDQYVGRAGLFAALPFLEGLALGVGGRVEGSPAEDLVGGSDGRRRPGYSVAVEPGVAWAFGRWSLTASVPVAVYRNRVKDLRDMRTGGQGDAAFADYAVTLGAAYRFAAADGRGADGRGADGRGADGRGAHGQGAARPPAEASGASLPGASLPGASLPGASLPAALRDGPVLAVVWATWCPVCKDQLPVVDGLRAELEAQGIRVVALSVEDAADADAVRRVAQERGLSLQVEAVGPAITDLSGPTVPAVLYADGGRVRFHLSGLVTAEVIRGALAAARGGAGPPAMF